MLDLNKVTRNESGDTTHEYIREDSTTFKVSAKYNPYFDKPLNNTMDTLKDVKLFHKLFNHPILETPEIPSPSRCALRVELLSEELKELKEAIAAKDIVQVGDALGDLQYVLSGAIHEFGLGNIFHKVFGEIQRSNMSKACTTVEEALETIKFNEAAHGKCSYFPKEVWDYENETPTTIYVVFRESDKKTIKSINYSPADLSFILNN